MIATKNKLDYLIRRKKKRLEALKETMQSSNINWSKTQGRTNNNGTEDFIIYIASISREIKDLEEQRTEVLKEITEAIAQIKEPIIYINEVPADKVRDILTLYYIENLEVTKIAKKIKEDIPTVLYCINIKPLYNKL